jgi:hypothetical protein
MAAAAAAAAAESDAPLIAPLLPARPPACLQPITMMRNALGREEGGSGVPLDKEAYEKSTAYWEAYAQIQ